MRVNQILMALFNCFRAAQLSGSLRPVPLRPIQSLHLAPAETNCKLFAEEAKLLDLNEPTNTSCVNWNQYYTTCKQSGENPFQGTISFDNIGMAWVAIFLVS